MLELKDNRIKSERLEDYFLTLEQRKQRLQAKLERAKIIAQELKQRETLVQGR